MFNLMVPSFTNESTRNAIFQISRFHNIKLLKPLPTVGPVCLYNCGSAPCVSQTCFVHEVFIFFSFNNGDSCHVSILSPTCQECGLLSLHSLVM